MNTEIKNDKVFNQKTKGTDVFSNFRYDIPAGVVVFLVALPLCLGIALASGAPLISGLIAGIVGGLIVGFLSGSALGVSGPAAGLTVIVFGAIHELGFEAFLLAVVISGIFQMLMGFGRAGIIGYYFPSSVITGMLSGIGIIIFLKQIPHAIGYDRDYEGDLSFFQPDDFTTLSELTHIFQFISPGAIIITIISLVILVLWERPVVKARHWLRLVPGPLVSVTAGIVMNQFLLQSFPEFAVTGEHLVRLPIADSGADLLNSITFPDFSQITNIHVYLTALTLAVVASLETLLCVEAIDKLDPQKRVTPTNRELIAQGAGNLCSGLIGGLPVTQVIVRSSANLQSGAKTKASAVIHGVLLLISVLLIPHVLNMMPLASLAAILLIVGYKLARPELFKRMYAAGLYHFVPFVATVLGLVFTDLLVGIGIGMAIALFCILLENYKTALYFHKKQKGNKTYIKLGENVSFLNKANILQTLDHLPDRSEVVIDATSTRYIDYDVFEIIQNFKIEAEQKGIKLVIENLSGYGNIEPVSNALPHTKETQWFLTPGRVLEILQEGNRRFVHNLRSNRNLLEQVNITREGQFPMAIILSCIDSRTSVELIFDLGLGDVFSARVAGNVVNDDILGSMEFACKFAGSKLIVVLGHTHCGAIKGACDHVEFDHLTGLLEKIKPAIDSLATPIDDGSGSQVDVFVQNVAERNVQLVVESIKKESPALEAMRQHGDIDIIGGMYDIETGKVDFFLDN